MPTTINVSKPLQFTITSGIANTRVSFLNRTTGEIKSVDDKGVAIRISGTSKVMFDCKYFSSYSTGDVVECKVSGKSYGSGTITLTADTADVQTATFSVTTTTLSTGGL